MKKLILLLIFNYFLIISVSYAGIDFDGTDDKVNVADTTTLGVINSITIAGWINRSGAQPIEGFGTFIVKKPSAGQPPFIIWIKNAGARLRLQATVDDGVWEITNNFVIGEWHQIIWTWVSGAKPKCYFDGIEQSVSGGTLTGNLRTNSNDVTIGYIDDPNKYWFYGQINEVGVWDTALTATEISLHYNSKIKGMAYQIRSVNLKVYLPLNDLADGGNLDGFTFIDRSGNGYDGIGDDNDASGGQGKAEEVLSYPD